ncbi:CRISPR-associated protein cas1 [Lactobacillus selangorensis]|uniref:CRISPR-associated endonuclease Cas1 n=1 Tax=Lactobacillus selangorensis TaxID=81857 RepID=A0A0R2GBM2_9LACO|nr:type I-B CRISPR-associated endonuclease Cas1b [Lactobacillus selangorensis]KRN29266.1 CRISPR-associated protein cas1 [Lactobacillus selangorensis]KRN34205.1 CRISPR-associated protein cas1 [Lactobacillus selangorensis]
MESYYLFSSGNLQLKDNVIRLTTAEGRYKDLMIEQTRDIYLFGEVTTNTKCLNYLSQNKIPLHLFNHYGYYAGSFYPREANVSGKLLIEQVKAELDLEKRLYIAQKLVDSAAHNCLRNLQYYRTRGKDVNAEIAQIKALRKEIPRSKNIHELMGIEGDWHAVYYSAWPAIFNTNTGFTKRVRRPPDNLVNTLLSFLNMLTYSACLSEIYVSQLNPTISYLHTPSERRFSLSLDISEIFKPLLVDRLIFTLVNKKMITEKDFELGSNNCYLKESGQQKVLHQFDDRLKQTIMDKNLHRKVSYRRLMRLECYRLIKYLLGEEEYEPFKMWW